MSEPTQPGDHLDPSRFDAIIDEAGPDSILVIIDRSMGPVVRGVCQAEDVWQETLALAWRDRAQHTWTDVRAYRSWLITIAKNRIRKIARDATTEKRGGKGTRALFSDFEQAEGVSSLGNLLPAGSETPSRVASSRERSRVMLAALAELPEEDQALLQARLFEERPMEDVAGEMGIHLSAAWRRFRKALEAYTKRLEVLRSRSVSPPQP
ncbi:MAG: RNA polymerase sigma factor [Planctomycetes bacterium]|nr:RNA polymerase sigma factor [Planctomycetota bacterium]